MKYRVFLKLVSHGLRKKAYDPLRDGRKARMLYDVWKRKIGRCPPSQAAYEYGPLVDRMMR